MLWGTEGQLAELFGARRGMGSPPAHVYVPLRLRKAFVDCFGAYYGPTVKALEAAGSGRDAMERDLEALGLAWNRLQQPGAIAVPSTYLESVGLRR